MSFTEENRTPWSLQLGRNARPTWLGMGGRLASESLAGLVWITHVTDQRLCFGDRDVSASCLKVSTTSGAFRGLAMFLVVFGFQSLTRIAFSATFT